MEKPSRNSRPAEKKKPHLKIIPCIDHFVQKRIIEELDYIRTLAEKGKIESIVFYYELHGGAYHIHMDGCEDILRTSSRLISMGLRRLGH